MTLEISSMPKLDFEFSFSGRGPQHRFACYFAFCYPPTPTLVRRAGNPPKAAHRRRELCQVPATPCQVPATTLREQRPSSGSVIAGGGGALVDHSGAGGLITQFPCQAPGCRGPGWREFRQNCVKYYIPHVTQYATYVTFHTKWHIYSRYHTILRYSTKITDIKYSTGYHIYHM